MAVITVSDQTVPQDRQEVTALSIARCSLIGVIPTAKCFLPIDSVANANYLLMNYYRTEESEFYPGAKRKSAHPGNSVSQDAWPQGLPQYCVAMSGGGIRSAAFSLGVLQGLAAKDAVKDIDIISSVSGGGYTLAWLQWQLQKTKDHRDPTTVLLDERAVNELEANVEENWASGPELGGILGPRVDALVTGPFNKLTHTLFPDYSQPTVDTTRIGYARMIKDVFFPGGGFKISNIETAIKSDKKIIPYPIFNSSVSVGKPIPCRSEPSLEDSVFEFTPLRQGSNRLGYSDIYIDFGADINTLVATSAAAPDDACTRNKTPLIKLAGRAGMEYGGFYSASFIFDTGNPIQPKGTDGLYLSQDVRLSDGGFTENLGAFSVIKRACEHILIIDAEEDANLQFTSLKRLQKAIAKEYGFRLSISPGIEEVGAHNENSAESSSPVNQSSAGLNSSGAIYEGDLREIPYPGRPIGLRPTITYIKLMADRKAVDKYQGFLATFITNQNAACKIDGNRKGCMFPHDPTSMQRYVDGRFKAYRMLGRQITESCISSDWRVSPNCAFRAGVALAAGR